ncbi:MAG TPA: hypothetical protein VJ485_01045 [archaeon]|nr:hypothetical protein [archaeon]
MAKSEERKYTKEEVLEIAKIYHKYIDGQMRTFAMEEGCTKFYRNILSEMKKYPDIFEDDIRCIENAISY